MATPQHQTLTQILANTIRDHPGFGIVAAVFTAVTAILGTWWGVVGLIDSEVEGSVAVAAAAMKVSLIETVNSRAQMSRLYAVQADGKRSGQLSDLIAAADQGRSIFVRYTRKGSQNGQPYRNEWFRGCDAFSLDYISGNDILTCFILRLPDTQILETGREIVEPTAFEDYSVSTEGVVRWRKYTVANGEIIEDPTAYVAQGTDIQWWAAPLPITVSTDP